MTTKNIELAKGSWALVAQMDMVVVGSLFYGKLFELSPEVKPMFSRAPMPEQSRKLLVMLTYVISKLDTLGDILEEVKRLAQRHNGYGVKAEHYAAVGAALLWTLEQGLAETWNEDLKTAWTEVYTTLAGAMIEAQHASA